MDWTLVCFCLFISFLLDFVSYGTAYKRIFFFFSIQLICNWRACEFYDEIRIGIQYIPFGFHNITTISDRAQNETKTKKKLFCDQIQEKLLSMGKRQKIDRAHVRMHLTHQHYCTAFIITLIHSVDIMKHIEYGFLEYGASSMEIHLFIRSQKIVDKFVDFIGSTWHTKTHALAKIYIKWLQ